MLYPTGRAFKMPFGGILEKLHTNLALSEQRAITDALSILDSAIPDNPNFTSDDATGWEKRLGLISNPLVSLTNRMLAIKRKMNHPGDILPRQNYLYLQNQLQAAGFNVFVYENIFDDGMGGKIPKIPSDVLIGPSMSQFMYNDHQYGDSQMGGAFTNICVSYLDETIDNNQYGSNMNLKSTFFIGGATIGSVAYVDANRRLEFRQLILKAKPTQTLAYLLVKYI